MLPNIDIIVPTYNRPSDIKTFICEIAKQTYTNYTVYIVDDCGDYDLTDYIPKRNNKLKFERLEKNSGQAFIRNYIVSKTKGDIIVFMDDDAYFTEETGLEQIVSYFNSSKIGGLMFDILEPNKDWLSARKKLSDMQELGEFIACGAAFKREYFEKTNGFSHLFHSYGEETEITIQLIQNNAKVYFGSKVKVFHDYNPAERSVEWLKRFKYNSVRNDILIVLSKYPLRYVFTYFFGKIFSHILFVLRKRDLILINLVQIFKGILGSLFLFKKIKRSPMTNNQFKYWHSKRF